MIYFNDKWKIFRPGFSQFDGPGRIISPGLRHSIIEKYLGRGWILGIAMKDSIKSKFLKIIISWFNFIIKFKYRKLLLISACFLNACTSYISEVLAWE